MALDDADYRRDVGAFFKSLHGTLNHLLLTDRLWLRPLTGEGEVPATLDAIIQDDRRGLTLHRADEDDRLIGYIKALYEIKIQSTVKFSNSSGKAFEQPLSQILSTAPPRTGPHDIVDLYRPRATVAGSAAHAAWGSAPDLRTLVDAA